MLCNPARSRAQTIAGESVVSVVADARRLRHHSELPNFPDLVSDSAHRNAELTRCGRAISSDQVEGLKDGRKLYVFQRSSCQCHRFNWMETKKFALDRILIWMRRANRLDSSFEWAFGGHARNDRNTNQKWQRRRGSPAFDGAGRFRSAPSISRSARRSGRYFSVL